MKLPALVIVILAAGCDTVTTDSAPEPWEAVAVVLDSTLFRSPSGYALMDRMLPAEDGTTPAPNATHDAAVLAALDALPFISVCRFDECPVGTETRARTMCEPPAIMGEDARVTCVLATSQSSAEFVYASLHVVGDSWKIERLEMWSADAGRTFELF